MRDTNHTNPGEKHSNKDKSKARTKPNKLSEFDQIVMAFAKDANSDKIESANQEGLEGSLRSLLIAFTINDSTNSGSIVTTVLANSGVQKALKKLTINAFHRMMEKYPKGVNWLVWSEHFKLSDVLFKKHVANPLGELEKIKATNESIYNTAIARDEVLNKIVKIHQSQDETTTHATSSHIEEQATTNIAVDNGLKHSDAYHTTVLTAIGDALFSAYKETRTGIIGRPDNNILGVLGTMYIDSLHGISIKCTDGLAKALANFFELSNAQTNSILASHSFLASPYPSKKAYQESINSIKSSIDVFFKSLQSKPRDIIGQLSQAKKINHILSKACDKLSPITELEYQSVPAIMKNFTDAVSLSTSIERLNTINNSLMHRNSFVA